MSAGLPMIAFSARLPRVSGRVADPARAVLSVGEGGAVGVQPDDLLTDLDAVPKSIDTSSPWSPRCCEPATSTLPYGVHAAASASGGDLARCGWRRRPSVGPRCATERLRRPVRIAVFVAVPASAMVGPAHAK